jgi:hypothetical protein
VAKAPETSTSMPEKANFILAGRNPDVLTCIANLSNDEIFTPPELANRILDNVAKAWADSNHGKILWSDKSAKFLDPFTKSGVFLREIAARLIEGLKDEIPDLQHRVNHIFTKQVFGIAITQLTAYIARRSLYCSKFANGPHSVVTAFSKGDGYGKSSGHVWFERLEHEWKNDDTCSYCGASRSSLDRGESLESHAYAFIHTNNIKARVAEFFGAGMKFDVIIGNPPYQLNTEGFGTQARPIYNHFVEQAKRLEPRLLAMVIPARWFSGGMGLGNFREAMLKDDRLKTIEDFPDSNDVFPGTQIKGGICFFVWDRDNPGLCSVRTHFKGQESSAVKRSLLEPGLDVFIRYNEAIPILKKITKIETGSTASLSLPEEKQFMQLVSAIGAFGLPSTFQGRSTKRPGDVLVYRNGGTGYIARSELTKETHVINKWKVFIPRAGSGSDAFPHPILGKPFLGSPGSVSSWTYMYIGPFKSKAEASNVISYITTKIFRFLVLLHKPSQDATKGVYAFVPLQDFTKPWTDKELCKQYGITKDEFAFIDSMIRPMDVSDE